MSELKRIDGFGCGGCINCISVSKEIPAKYCRKPIKIMWNAEKSEVYFTHHVIINRDKRLDDCPLERDDD
jgi:hypothetical protein